MTIKVPGLERVVVVFPTTLDSYVVTVGDVLDAVYRAVKMSAIEHAKHVIADHKTLPVVGQIDLRWRGVDEYLAIKRRVGENHWWAGLYPCQRERDIWVLRTRRAGY